MLPTCQRLLQALRRFENMSSIRINGAAPVADLVMLAVELEQDAGAWRVRRSRPTPEVLQMLL